jgi:hypothetical protein
VSRKVKVILAGFAQTYAVPMANLLAQEHNWEICYWVSGRAVKEAVNKNFPTTIFHNSGNARRGILPDPQPEFKVSALDGPLLNSMAETERNVLAQGDRLNLYHTTFSYQDRINLYHRLLKYWVSVMNEIKPDLVVFNTIPHLMFDQIIYDLCKKNSIQTVILEKTNITGLIYSYSRYEEGSTDILQAYRQRLLEYNGKRVPLSENLESVITKGDGDYNSAMPIGLLSAKKNSGVGANERISQKPPLLGASVWKFSHYWQRLKIQFERLVLGRVPETVGKIRTRSLDDRRMSRREYIRLRWNIKIQRNQLLKTYAALSQDVDLKKPYIYVTLQYQPEQSTNPQGGAFQHQDLMVDLISNSVPSDWNVYVKEHVAALLSHSQFERSRTPEFYEKLAALPNVTLVKPETNPFDFIDGAKAVATISGSSGWEAVLRGRPAFLFGYSWYRGCEGVFETRSKENLMKAIDKIDGGYQVDREKIRLFLQVIEEKGFSGYNIPSWGASSGISPDENAAAIASELSKYSIALGTIDI